ncbi:MAG: phosphoribosylglycinamide formyltransferase [Bacteroidales bacterium]|nr:phosphoribosylglycinamide formyltransferase [Bacteroidales bacterium]HPO66517.1 phosphoribosylglycinamide formyltransferase [Bacteroidales bacterium]
MKNIAIFASGSGSNAQAIVEYFRKQGKDPVKLILTNNPKAYVLERAKQLGIESVVFTSEDLYHRTTVLDILQSKQIDFIVLAGFLWLIPTALLKTYKGKIVNIHPALLPKYGGKGMYGMKVHEAVVANREKETGITIHWVDEEYDHGDIILQVSRPVDPTDTPEKVAAKVHELEYLHYPRIIEQLIS